MSCKEERNSQRRPQDCCRWCGNTRPAKGIWQGATHWLLVLSSGDGTGGEVPNGTLHDEQDNETTVYDL